MRNAPNWLLAFMFGVTGAVVLAVGYRFIRGWPWATGLVCSALLAILGRWYIAVRNADETVALRTVRSLVLLIVLLAIVIPSLLRQMLGLP